MKLNENQSSEIPIGIIQYLMLPIVLSVRLQDTNNMHPSFRCHDRKLLCVVIFGLDDFR
jgi:hypothetical protein